MVTVAPGGEADRATLSALLRAPIVIAPDPKDLVVPELAVVSDVLRARFDARGDSLPVAALDINDRFAQEAGFSSGFNKDSLHRALWAGYDKGLKSINLALPAFYFLSRFYHTDGVWLVKKMGEEALRRWLLAQLDVKGLTPDDFIKPLILMIPFDDAAVLTGWLSGRGYTGNLNNFYGVLADRCNEIGIYIKPNDLRGIVESVTD